MKVWKISSHRSDIDGLRAIAVIPVVLFHLGLGMRGGWVGVDVFFVISGFLITSLIVRDLQESKFSLKGFWERRARRILPAAIVMSVASLIAGWFLFAPDDFRALGDSVVNHSVFLSNVYFWQQSGYFAAPSELQPLLHTWSLAVEEQFYFCLPLLLLFFWSARRRSGEAVLVALFVLSFSLSVLGVYRFPEATFYLLPTRAWELLAGALLASVGGMGTGVRQRWLGEVLGWGGLGAVLGSMVYYTEETLFPGMGALPPCLGTVAIIASSGRVRTSLCILLSHRWVVFIGLISYSLYLWHWPLIVFAKQASMGGLDTGDRLLLLAVSVAIATLSWRFIETPFRQRTLLPTPRHVAVTSISALATLVGIGLFVYVEKGIPSRFSAELQQFAEGGNDRNPRQGETHNLDAKILRKRGLPILSQGSASAASELLVWGDSHCDAIVPAIRNLCEEYGIRAYAATHNATIPLLGTYKSAGKKGDYLEFNNAVFDFVKTNGMNHVLLIGKWSSCIDPLPGEVMSRSRSFLRGSKDRGINHDSNDAKSVFQVALDDTIGRLRELGTQIWIMEEVPRHHEVVPNLLIKAVMAGRDPSRVGIPTAEHKSRTEEVRDIFAQAEGAHVHLLDPTPLLKDKAGIYRAAYEGHALYYDTNHLSVAGAMHLRPLFEPLVEQILSDRKALAGSADLQD